VNACERCGKQSDPASYELMDYCAECSRNLCDDCMAKGCCGQVPATSGTEAAEVSGNNHVGGGR
jgi:hypothetical protein